MKARRQKQRADARKINIEEEYEVEFWTDHFRVSKPKLKEAVNAVGDSADAVRKYLKISLR
jgi:hypothetical protein